MSRHFSALNDAVSSRRLEQEGASMRSATQWQIKFRRWVKNRDNPVSNTLFRLYRWGTSASVPVIPGVHRMLYGLHRGIASGWDGARRVLWYTPLFQSRLERPAPGLYLYNGMPFIAGTVSVEIGANCRVAGRIDILGRTQGDVVPRLVVGSNVDLGWGSHIAVGRSITIGDNVRLSSGVRLIGYPGHPIDAAARARGAADTDDQIGDIVLEDDVWLAAGVTVNRGVTIGRGTIVATGSVVTHSLPPFCLAAGVPAKVVRQLPAAAASPSA